jgi:hypothetical protein
MAISSHPALTFGVRSNGRGRVVKAGGTMDGQDMFYFIKSAFGEIWPFLRVVENQILGPLGWCLWLAVPRSFFLMEVRKSR